MTARLQKVVRVQRHNTRLIGLGHISKDTVNHANQHSVLPWVASILNDGHYVGAFFAHVEQISTRAMRELNGIDQALGSNNVGNVTHSSTRCCAQVQNLFAGSHVDVVDTTENGGCQFRSEGVPRAVLDFLDWVGAALGSRNFNLDFLLAVDSVARDEILGCEDVLLALCDEDSAMSVWFDDYFGASSGTSTTTTASSATASSAPATTTSSW